MARYGTLFQAAIMDVTSLTIVCFHLHMFCLNALVLTFHSSPPPKNNKTTYEPIFKLYNPRDYCYYNTTAILDIRISLLIDCEHSIFTVLGLCKDTRYIVCLSNAFHAIWLKMEEKKKGKVYSN